MIVYPPTPPRKVSMSNNTNINNSISTSSTSSSGVNIINNNNNNNNNSSNNNNKSNSCSVHNSSKRQAHIQWRLTNVHQGVVKVDSTQLSSLLKTEPIEKYYQLDEEPFAQGAFASVRKVRNLETGQVYAAKFSNRTRYGENSTAEIYHEIALLSLCSPSPRIVKLHDVFQTSDEIIIVMEFAPGGDMQTIIDDNIVPFEADVVRFVQHVVEGLVYMHHRKIAHLDIKPQNLVMMGDFPDCDVKVCDFEISRIILDGTQIRELLGTPEYVAPEILHYEPITLAADMWSLGVTVYVLLTGFSPFGGETDQETFLNISQARLDFPEELFEDVSEDAQDFIKKLLVRNPKGRMTAKECLRHPWLANNKRKSKKSNSKNNSSSISLIDSNRSRVGCSSCTGTTTGSSSNHHKNLRRYLSKSREALFEKVISKHKQQQQNIVEQKTTGENLRKTTLLSQYDKTRRMCESQMSLVSKSRERLLQGSMSPSITRSREKLYGIKSLSKSHEVLNLCKTVSNVIASTIKSNINDNENKKASLPLEGLLKTLTRAATASGELITSNVSNNNNNKNGTDNIKENNILSNKTDLTSLENQKPSTSTLTEIDTNKSENNNNKDITKEKENDKVVIASLPTLPEYQPLQTVLTLLRNNKNVSNNNNSSIIVINSTNEEKDQKVTKEEEECNNKSKQNDNSITLLYNNSNDNKDNTIKKIIEREVDDEGKLKEKDDSYKKEEVPLNKSMQNENHNSLTSLFHNSDITIVNDYNKNEKEENCKTNEGGEKVNDKQLNKLIERENSCKEDSELTSLIQRPKLFLTKQLSVISSEGDLNSPAISQTDSLSLTEEGNSSLSSSSSAASDSSGEISEDDVNGSLERITNDVISSDDDNLEICKNNDNNVNNGNNEDDEPRFTVKQLISAYNMHQEIVTKTSLEVTMNTTMNSEQKILPVIEKIPNNKFPTGPNALRLFIPDLHISRSSKIKKTKSRSSRNRKKNSCQDESKQKEKTKHSSEENTKELLETNTDDNKIVEVDNTETTNNKILNNDNINDEKNKISEGNKTEANNNDGEVVMKTEIKEIIKDTSSTVNDETTIIYDRSNSLSSETSGVSSKTSRTSSTTSGAISSEESNPLNLSQPQLSQKKSRRSSGIVTSTVSSNDGDNNGEASNKTTVSTTITNTNVKSSEKSHHNTSSTFTPRLNRKSYPNTSTRSSLNVSQPSTEKTRRKSNPVMKPPFY
ncbi:uncharacterized protein LOC142333647 [Lycorma delicatula]|uniref:uncharacterized protein LOC142333647 n=1 Tax=Lycorma delicatula TaxID=130591 RepID=UPI003F50FEC1